MAKAVHIETELAKLPVMRGRTPDTPLEEEDKAFATLAELGDGGVFAGSFEGESPWERHTKGDELVHILAGETRLTLLTEDGPQELVMSAGMLTVSGVVTDASSQVMFVDVSVDYGAWKPAFADDGMFDSRSESFRLVVEGLEEEEHAVSVRAADRSGNPVVVRKLSR